MEKVNVNLPKLIGKGYASFWKTKKFYRVVKGGRASKKSTTAAFWYIYNIMKYTGANVVVVRQVYNTHKNSTFSELKKAAKRLEVYHLWKFTESPLQATYLPTGQKILFYGFDDPMKLTSLTVDNGFLCWAWFEEVFEIVNEEDFNTFVEGIRGLVPEPLFKQVTLTYNPWINTHWSKTRFWDVEPEDTFRDTTTHECNEFLDAADHKRITDLEKTNPERYKVVGLGEYGIPGGAYFDEFRTDIHTCQPFTISAGWKRYITIDYGLDMLAAYWIATDLTGRAYVYKELYQPGLIISEAAKAIAAMIDEEIYDIVAPPDLWNRRQETGKSAAELFDDYGISLSKANNNRVQGWYNLKEWLKPYTDEFGDGDQTANLVIFKNCVNLIRTLPQLQCDEKDPNDVATEPHELTHGPDAIRYFIAARPCPDNGQGSFLPGSAPGRRKGQGDFDLDLDDEDWEDEEERGRPGFYGM